MTSMALPALPGLPIMAFFNCFSLILASAFSNFLESTIVLFCFFIIQILELSTTLSLNVSSKLAICTGASKVICFSTNPSDGLIS
ncbi:unnamed protein product [Schistosoma margrebowiei]|uniref:Uncharacterized protein n=1 Tax=Schistosoma margrebowiei TaxID=48269 RepID=A0A3P8F631_9TREM|nr:unnamed protein product [Schistosoma margrebowiei]